MGGRSALEETSSQLEKCRDSNLTSQPGTYALLLRLEVEREFTVGRLGRFCLPAGVYVYAGSARASGGLAARIRRHLRHPKPLHWHIDYLRAWAQPEAVWLTEGMEHRECIWARALADMAQASLPAPGFGASDCRCRAHLIHFPDRPDQTEFAKRVEVQFLEIEINERPIASP